MRLNKYGLPDGLIILQVDDSLAYGYPTFMRYEQKAAAVFNSNPRNNLSSSQLPFNITDIRMETTLAT